jgi:hypothetical protein
MDAYVFLRFMRICAQFCILCALGGVGILCPVYYTSYGDQLGIAGINLYTMGNIQPGGNRLWASCAFCWLFNLLFLSLMHSEYRHFVTLRQRYFYHGDSPVSLPLSIAPLTAPAPLSVPLTEEGGPLKVESTEGGAGGEGPSQQYYSVLVENIPFFYRSDHRLKELLNSWFPGQVHSAHVACNTDELRELIEKREKLLGQLEIAIAKYEASERTERPKVHLWRSGAEGGGQPVWFSCSSCGLTKTVDAIEHLTAELSEMNHRIRRLQSQILRSDSSRTSSEASTASASAPRLQQVFLSTLLNPLLHEKETPEPPPAPPSPSTALLKDSSERHYATRPTSREEPPPDELRPSEFGYRSGTGFVTFLSRSTQVQAYQIHVLSDIHSSLLISQAPSSEDILWENLPASTETQQHGQRITSALFTGGMLFWGSVLAFIAAVSNLSNLEKYLPFISDLDPVLYSLLAGILPVVVMNLFLSLLPAIFAYGATRVEKRKTKSLVQTEVFRWYFGYQLANVYLLLLAGSLFTALSDAIADPSSIIRLLAAALPSVSVFFINYLLTEILTSAPGELLQLVPFLIWNAYRLLIPEPSLTRRQLFSGPLQPTEFDYGSSLPSYLFVLCIVLTYMTIAPLVSLLGALYFSLFYAVLKFKFLFVFVPSFETGGSFFFDLHAFSMRGLLVSAVTMVGYMAVKEGVAQAPFVLPIPFVVWRYWNYTTASFERLSKDMAYSRAVQADTEQAAVGAPQSLDSSSPPSCPSPSFDRRFFLDAALTASWNESPQPYRVEGRPLFTRFGGLDEAYHEEVEAGESSQPGTPAPATAQSDSDQLEQASGDASAV